MRFSLASTTLFATYMLSGMEEHLVGAFAFQIQSKRVPCERQYVVRENKSSLMAKYEGPGEDIEDAFDPDSAVSRSGKGQGLDSEVRSKLLAESIAPWRTLRLFVYSTAGTGAFVGTLITAGSLAAASVTGADVNEIYKNIAIDLTAVAASAVFFKLDLDKGKELESNVQEKIQRKKEMKEAAKAMKMREKDILDLNVSIKVSEDGDTREAPIGVLQSGAKQHAVIMIGPQSYTRDCLFSAQLVKRDVFARSNVLVIPYTINKDQTKPSGGFGERAEEKEAYVAQPVGDEWENYINAEINDAVAQGGEKMKEDGIVIVMRNDGEVIRRGVGDVPWKMIVNELNGVTETSPASILE